MEAHIVLVNLDNPGCHRPTLSSLFFARGPA